MANSANGMLKLNPVQLNYVKISKEKFMKVGMISIMIMKRMSIFQRL